MTKHVTAGDILGCKTGKALFSYMNLQVNSFVRGEKTLKIFYLEGMAPAGTCLLVTLTAS